MPITLLSTVASAAPDTPILLGVIIAGLIIVFSNPLLKFLGTNEEMWQYARNYMLILAVGSPAMLLNYAIACLVRGEGAIKPGLIANFVSTGMNILLDPVLILGVKMGVSGAALATVLSNVIGIVYLIWYNKGYCRNLCVIIQKANEIHIRHVVDYHNQNRDQGWDPHGKYCFPYRFLKYFLILHRFLLPHMPYCKNYSLASAKL